MRLVVVGTGSSGNGYVLKSEQPDGLSLLLEAGCNRNETMKALKFDSTHLHTLLITHEHGDHAQHYKQYADIGMHIIASGGTKKSLGIDGRFWSTTAVPGKLMKIGDEWRINSFKVQHDSAEPLGYLLHNEECGKVLFLTDFARAMIHTTNVSTFIVECNWDNASLNASEDPVSMKKRIMLTHQSLKGLKTFLSMQNLENAKQIVLIHASSRNLDKDLAVREIQEAFGIPVYMAEKGLEIQL